MTVSRSERSDPEKDSLRRRFDAYRRNLSEREYERLSHEAVSRAVRLPELRRARVVHVYWPLVARRELDTRPLIGWLQKRRREIVLPVVLKFGERDTDAPRLAHVRYPGEEALRLNRWGISEPPPDQSVSIDELDAVIVPALGVGKDGHRIGHGLGYYDEFLAGIDVPKICLAYEACIVDHIPAAAHDVPIDIIVSEQAIYRPTPLQRPEE